MHPNPAATPAAGFVIGPLADVVFIAIFAL
jgi:hypothetical protein